jgi:hypothetical protein
MITERMENSTMKRINKRISQPIADATRHFSRPSHMAKYACDHDAANQVCIECLVGCLAIIEQRVKRLEKEVAELSPREDSEG